MDKILIVDDNPDNVDLISHMLESGSIESASAFSGLEAIKMMERDFYPIVLSDLMMPHMDGMELLEKIKKSWPNTEMIIVTAHGSIKSAVEAIKKGAYSYILKPFEPDDLLNEVQKVQDLQKMREENRSLKIALAQTRKTGPIIGNTAELKSILELIGTVANANTTVSILGESGTGKELVANAIHDQSKRSNGPFIKLACAALSENLLESELFGHEKGSFTGAVSQKKGRFEAANGGTLFLDEIGEISQTVQVKLLRFLQERQFERVGGTKTIKTDVRIITATNRDLAKEVQEGRFREDLYYRLNVITISVPPLRERLDDIPLLAHHFLEKYKMEVNRDMDGFTERALDALKKFHWPGNIRELQNVIERAVVLAKEKIIDINDLSDNFRETLSGKSFPFSGETLPPLKEAKQAFEKEYLERALEINKGNITRTADTINLARKNLQEKIKNYAIDVSAFQKKD